MTRMPFFRFCFAAALATLLVGCPDNTGVAPSGAGDDASPPPPDMGPMEMSVPDVPDVASLEEGPGPLSPRVQNETCRLPPAPPVGAMRLERAFPELTFERPLWMGYAPNDDRFVYFVEQAGRILVADAENPVTTEVFFEEEVRRGHNEEGLLGLAFHPDYVENGRFFIYYSASNPVRTVLSELRRSAARETVADPTTERVLLEIDQPFGNHNGGDIQFGPDGYLYVAVGDGGAGGDPLGNGQNPETLLATVLRIDVDSEDPGCGTPYGIPEDNPFAMERCQPGVTPAGAPEVFAWGLRNVWRMSFDKGTGALWGGDVGQDAREEINIIENGHNYGWSQVEGDICFQGDCDLEVFSEPVYAYDHDEGKSVTGGYVYRGSRLPELWGKYIFGDYETGRIWALERVPGGPPEVTPLTHSRRRIVSFGESPNGELYVVTFDADIQQLERVDPPMNLEPFPQRLSETGCYSDIANLVLAPGVVRFDVNSPLWTDGAVKLRSVALPPGETMYYQPDGAFGLPLGTVVLKTFTLEDGAGNVRRLETRVIHRDPNGWNGYTYRWEDDQQDAVLLDGALTEEVEGPTGRFTWIYPSRAQCDHCHVERFGYAVGLASRQLNRLYDYEGGTFNQLAAFAGAGLMEQAPEALPSTLPAFPDPHDDSASLEARVRGLLDANCASCHLPDGPTDAEIDLRVTTPFEEMKLCNIEPTRGESGIENAMLLAPGEPIRSVLVERMRTRGEGQMPPLGTSIIDGFGSALVGAWIEEMEGCP